MKISKDNLVEYSNFANLLADAAAEAILPHFRTTVNTTNKGGKLFDPVTEADIAAERAMRRLIISQYPEHGILGEEENARSGTSDLTWVLDPIDGTRAFITGMPLWGTLIALNDGERPVLGIMNQPFTGERYFGTAAGSNCNKVKISTRDCKSLSKATLLCTTPEMFHTNEHKIAFEQIARKVQMTRFGGDCYSYCMLASGFVDIIIEDMLKPYDVQALIPIIEGAGGVITNWQGECAKNGGSIVACGDKQLHNQVIELLRKKT